ncbi:MAG: hypothetical protein WA139_00250 [Candidatus Aenigmatarchaeota archaeon]
MQESDSGDVVNAKEDVGKRISAMVRKYGTPKKDIAAMISLGLYNESQKTPYNNFSVIKDLLAAMKFEYPSAVCGDGTSEEIPIYTTPFLSVFKMERHYNCCGINMCTAADRSKLEKMAKKYQIEAAECRKPVALGKRARKKPKAPNFLKDIVDGVLVCGNSEDQTLSVRFLKPQEGIATEEKMLKDYCGKHKCPMRDGFGEDRKVYYIDGKDFIKTAEKKIKESDVSGGRIFSDVDNIVKGIIERFPQHKEEVPPEIA